RGALYRARDSARAGDPAARRDRRRCRALFRHRAGASARRRGAAVTDDALPRGVAVLCLTRGGHAIARRIVALLPGAQLHGLAGRVDAADIAFDDTLAHLRALFA